jgi:ribosome biogenesis GTPase / thiamine phosphate phosphatase
VSTSSLVALGWDDRWAALAADLPSDRPVGRVTRVDRGRCTVATPHDDARPFAHDAVAVGDWVALDARGERVETVLTRRSALTRRAPGRATAELVLAANVDHVVILHGANRPLNVRRLERELVLAWDSGAVPIVVLSKADLAVDLDASLQEAARVAIGADVIALSNRTGQGVDELAARVGDGRTFVLIGASGVGKSSLVNRLLGDDLQVTQDIREADGRGRHTTTAGQLLVVPGGGVLIDTPGVREVGLWDGEEGIAQVFGDLEALALECRFTNCEHRTEPGCAVRAGVEADRIESWRKLNRDLERISKRREGWEIAQERKKRRAFAKSVRDLGSRP